MAPALTTLLAGGSAGVGGGEAAVRSALSDYSSRLPELLPLLEIEARVKAKTPFVVVALQEVRCSRTRRYSAPSWDDCACVKHALLPAMPGAQHAWGTA